MRRSTGGNRFIETDATRGDLMQSINDQLGDLYEWAEDSDQILDIGAISIETQRISNGRISVQVTADLKEKMNVDKSEDASGTTVRSPDGQ